MVKNSAWAHLTWPQLQAAAANDPVVLVPIACVETQGPWTPVGMEQILADRLAQDAAERTGSLALPAIPFGNSDSFMNIPGTIFVRPEVLSDLYYDVFRSVVRAGFKRILCLSYHIPNQPYVERAARLLREETGVVVTWMNPGALAATFLKDLFPDPVAARGHGAEPGLSLMRYVLDVPVPADADAGETSSSYRGLDVQGAALSFRGFPVGAPVGWEELYPRTGGFGNPTLGNVEIGRELYDRVLEYICALVEAIKSEAFAEPRDAPIA
jgi:creatinine amidohydrolase/Fe(II)-dependent formamide hydrolase-like protein